MKINLLPIEVYINRNTHFFAEIEWFLYKHFRKTRAIPCGRTKNDKYLCCCQPMERERVILSADKTECYCKVCGSIRIRSNHPIDLNQIGEF